MRYIGLTIGILWAQPSLPDSVRQLFEKDFAFDLVIGRTFPVIPTLSDTYPIVPLLSGHFRMGIAWHVNLYRALGVSVQGGYAFYRHVLRATTASSAPYADLMPEGYRWLKYRQGAVFLQTGIHWRRELQGEFFPRYWAELGGWIQREVGKSLKYVAVREGRSEKVRWDDVSPFLPWQGGLYLQVGRQLLGLSVYYHFLPIFPKGLTNTTPPRPYPQFRRWEVGFLLSL